MKALIFTEAGSGFGFGHLSRCVALKRYLLEAGFTVQIYNRGDFQSDCAINCDWLQNFNAKDANLAIVDSYYATYTHYENLQENAGICIAIDDFSRIAYPKNTIILNPALNAKELYKNTPNELFAGIEYGLLREAFTQHSTKKINEVIESVLITLGGNPPQNLLQEILTITQSELKNAKISVISPHKTCKAYCYTNLNAEEVKKLILEADLVISGGGVTMIEVQAMKTPSIAIEIAQNQRYQLTQWERFGVRSIKNPAQIPSVLKTLNFKERQKIYSTLSQIRIGEALPRFASMLHKRAKSRQKTTESLQTF